MTKKSEQQSPASSHNVRTKRKDGALNSGDNLSIDELLREIDKLSQQVATPELHEEVIDFSLVETGCCGELMLNTVPEKIQQKSYQHSSFTHIPLCEKQTPRELIENLYMMPKPTILSTKSNEKIAIEEIGEIDYRWWPREFNCNELYNIPVSKAKTTIETVKHKYNGALEGFEEVTISQATAADSTSLLRQPAATKDFVRGNTSHVPFKPGGIDEEGDIMSVLEPIKKYKLSLIAEEELRNLETGHHLQQLPPGFTKGVQFEIQSQEEKKSINIQSPVVIDKNPDGLLTTYEFKAQTAIAQPQEDSFLTRQRMERENVEKKKKRIMDLKSVFSDIAEEESPYEVAGESDESDDTSLISTQVQSVAKSDDMINEKNHEDSGIKRSDSLEDILNENEQMLMKKMKDASKKEKEWAIMNRLDMSNFNEMVPEMAIKYPFDLDVFQKEAIYHLENNESVFVSAHTSAGKTVVAEYAIALAQKHFTRVIYTSPIKTLSNQKFREFKKTFGDVGILTGDVQINPTATCLIMTTEILRSMLYKGADLIRDVEWVIFDEVHYINDPDRGVVWEEVIIMLPKHINLILLSATIPNAYDFADWIGRTKKKQIFVVGTLKRPVPLEHHLYYGGNIYKIVDANGNFLHQNYRKAIQAEKDKKARQTQKYKGGPKRMLKSEWVNIISTLDKKKLLPVVVFSFSRNKCEELAYGLSQTDLTTSKEKSEIHVFIENSISRLKGTDRELPQIKRIREILKCGIGVHHSGLLPIVKEVVEILFSRGLVKVLFATETFAMGVNMPAKTVIFSQLRKHDGREFRDLLSGEYIQMSGRAGRRGLDTTGVVIINAEDEIPEEPLLQKIIRGAATKLESKFKLAYNMILNLLRMEEFRVEDMIKRSFSEADKQKYLPNKELVFKSQNRLSELYSKEIECIYGEPDIENFHSYATELHEMNQKMQEHVLLSKLGQQAIVSGRVVVVQVEQYGPTLAVIVKGASAVKNTKMTSLLLLSANEQKSADEEGKQKKYLMLVLKLKQHPNIPAPTISGIHTFSPMLLVSGDQHGMISDDPSSSSISDLIEVPEKNIISITKSKLSIKAAQLTKKSGVESNAMRVTANQLIEIWKSSGPEGPEVFNPIVDFKLNALEFAELYKRRQLLIQKMTDSKCQKCPKQNEQFDEMDRRSILKQKLEKIKFVLSDNNLDLMPEYNKRVKVLQMLNYIDKERTVQLKGRVACEINACEELIVTEMIFENFFTPLTPEECVAVLSALISEAKSEEEPQLSDRLINAKEKLINLTMSLGQLQGECGIDTSPLDFKKELNFSLMEVAYEWAMQKPFSEICQLTSILEGNIVRSIYQIDQGCREVRNAARVIGDAALYQKMEKASQLIKRDIIFVSSLYVT